MFKAEKTAVKRYRLRQVILTEAVEREEQEQQLRHETQIMSK
ncbi:hypothetical protein [Pedobacter glucosidilyticus]|nr:hypothetical protein [Pedobacter glucosidilyticus]